MATTNTPLGWSAATSDDWIQISVDNVNWSSTLTNQSGDKPIYVKVTPGGNGDETGTITIDCLDCESDPRQQIVNVQRCGCTGGTTYTQWKDAEVTVDACATKATVEILGVKTRKYDNCPEREDKYSVSATEVYSISPNKTNQPQTIEKSYGGGPNENTVAVTIIQGAGPCVPSSCSCGVITPAANGVTIGSNDTSRHTIFNITNYNDCITDIGNVTFDEESASYADDYVTGMSDSNTYIYIKANGSNAGSQRAINATVKFKIIGSDDWCDATVHITHNGVGPQDDCNCNNDTKFVPVPGGTLTFESTEYGANNAKTIATIYDTTCIKTDSVFVEFAPGGLFTFAGVDNTGKVKVYANSLNNTEYTRSTTAEITYDAGEQKGCQKNVTVVQQPKNAPAKCYNIEVENESQITCQGGTITIKANRILANAE